MISRISQLKFTLLNLTSNLHKLRTPPNKPPRFPAHRSQPSLPIILICTIVYQCFFICIPFTVSTEFLYILLFEFRVKSYNKRNICWLIFHLQLFWSIILHMFSNLQLILHDFCLILVIQMHLFQLLLCWFVCWKSFLFFIIAWKDRKRGWVKRMSEDFQTFPVLSSEGFCD
jgi:hypothetical protein